MSLALLFHYLMLNVFRMLIHPSSGACNNLFVELFHGLCCSGLMCVGVTVWFGWGGVVSLCRLKHWSASACITIRMDVLTSETRWALNNEIIKQVTSGWSVFIKFSLYFMLAKLFSGLRAIYPFMIIKCPYYILFGRDSSVGIATHHGLDGLGIESRRERDFLRPSRPALGPTQPPMHGYRVFPRGKVAGAWR